MSLDCLLQMIADDVLAGGIQWHPISTGLVSHEKKSDRFLSLGFALSKGKWPLIWVGSRLPPSAPSVILELFGGVYLLAGS